MQKRYHIAKGINENVLKNDEVLEMTWQDFCGVTPNVPPMIFRAHTFATIQTVPVPDEEMWTGKRVVYLLDVVEDAGKGKEKEVSYQQECAVTYDADYVGYYAQTLLRNIGVTPEVPLDQLEGFDPTTDMKLVEKQFGSKLLTQKWETLRQVTIKASVIAQFNSTQAVDMREVDDFLKGMGIKGDKAEAIRNKAKADPKSFAALKSALMDSVSKLL